MPQRIQSKWYLGSKTEEEKQKTKELVLSSQKVLDILSKIVYNMSIDGEKVKSTDYDSPSWSHKQAHLNGRAEAFKDILNILTTTEH